MNEEILSTMDSINSKNEDYILGLIYYINIYTLWQFNIANWTITTFNGKTYCKWPFFLAMLNYQRVPFGKTCISMYKGESTRLMIMISHSHYSKWLFGWIGNTVSYFVSYPIQMGKLHQMIVLSDIHLEISHFTSLR